MPRVIPLPGATSVSRVEENVKGVALDDQEVALIDEIIAKMPVQGHRWAPMLQQFADK
jgi:pyridoxine 4-dehydrogenase